MTTPSTKRKTKWRTKTDAGLRCIRGKWVSKADHARLQPQIDQAAEAAADDIARATGEPSHD